MKYKGMTVNEALYASGLMDDFDKAVENKDIDKVKAILNKVELKGSSIPPILKSLGLVGNVGNVPNWCFCKFIISVT